MSENSNNSSFNLQVPSEEIAIMSGKSAVNGSLWRSAAHILAAALQQKFGGLLCLKEAVSEANEGFMCEWQLPQDRSVEANDLVELEKIVLKMAAEPHKFEVVEVSKAQAREVFDDNPFKLKQLGDHGGANLSLVKCAGIIDIANGSFLPDSADLKVIKLLKSSSSHGISLDGVKIVQRIYGIAFRLESEYSEWQNGQEEAAKRDHRRIGRDQELFFFHDLSPGSCFFLPKGALIYNRLIEWMRQEYRKRGYQEVMSPNMFSTQLWQISGHLEHYASNMFQMDVENQRFALKAMNCPGHCLMYGVRPRSVRELPLRFAEFGVLHRNELRGALHGLSRVRRFCQDDAHIFCSQEQVASEIRGCLEFFKHVYCDVLGFNNFHIKLSTRPDQFLGDQAIWDLAESQLAAILDEFGFPWSVNPGDGAFYGPKIDILFMDAQKRQHQCATFQLDFQFPLRFDLEYSEADECQTKKRPIMIHRAILGSLERFIAVYAEHCGGKWPFWLSPRQICIVPVNSSSQVLVQRCKELEHMLVVEGFTTEAEIGDNAGLNRKIRKAQMDQFNFVLVIGDKELANGTANVRSRNNKILGEWNVDDLLKRMCELASSRVLNAEEVI